MNKRHHNRSSDLTTSASVTIVALWSFAPAT
jgi:hypothetical protein